MRLADPWYLLLLLPTLFWLWSYLKPKARPGVRFSSVGLVTRLPEFKSASVARHAPFTLRFVAVLLMVLALARPQTGYSEREIISKGIDIMLTLDLSSSMSATDLKPNRLASAKAVIDEFIKGRVNDRIGLVIFAAHGYTQCPLTLDYPILAQFLEQSHIGLIEDGTAIGMAVATAANRMKDSTAKSRIVILLTDGVNNRGAIDPMTAAKMAKAVNVKVYTIGVGKEGVFHQTVTGPGGVPRRVQVQTQIDEKLLKEIAKSTGGKFFRAEDEEALAQIYGEIDRLEKTDIKVKLYARYTDWFAWLLIPALLLMLAELVLPLTRFRVTP